MRTKLFVLGVLCAIFMGEVKAQGNPSVNGGDSIALVHLYHQMNGDQWMNSWDLSKPVFDWQGVVISAEGRVTELSLENNNLVGSIPEAIGELDSLRQLDFSGNQLEGKIPSEIGGLEELVLLNLSSNKLKGKVPSSLKKLKQLSELYINSNQLAKLPNLSALNPTIFQVEDNKFNFGDIIQNEEILTKYSPQARIGKEQGIVLREGDELTIEVNDLTDGNQYSWYVDGEQIAGATEFSYSIENFLASDTGVYECRVTNPMASDLTLVRNSVTLEMLKLKTNSLTVKENKEIGAAIGKLATNDKKGRHTFFLSGPDAASFQLGGDEDNILQSAKAFNYENKSNYQITVEAVDAEMISSEWDMNVTILDANEAPTSITLDNGDIDENVPAGTVVSDLFVVDPDQDDTHTFVLSGGGATKFSIKNGKLVTADGLDFEKKSKYNLRLKARDQGGLRITERFEITINDVNDPPNRITLKGKSVREGLSAGSEIGTVKATDQDAGDSLTLALSGLDAQNFQLVNDKLVSTVTFDFEQQSQYEVTLSATDKQGVLTSEMFTVSIKDMNEPPTAIELSNSEVAEDISNALIGVITITDEDIDDTHTLSLSGADTVRFQIGGENGDELLSVGAFDYEEKNSYEVMISATDAEGLTIDKSFTITVTDVDDVLGIEDEHLATVYPNPARGHFIIGLDSSVQGASWELTDLGGREVLFEGKHHRNTDSPIPVDVGNLKSGIYLLKINSDAHHITKKLIISE